MVVEIVRNEKFEEAKGRITKVKIIKDDRENKEIEITVNENGKERIFNAVNIISNKPPFTTRIEDLHGKNVIVTPNNPVSVL
jgi:hypothetical protein